MIRFGKSPQHIQKNPKKPDNLEILTLLDNCTLILKDDRITLRNMVKEGNQDVIAILNHYKKGNNLKDLSTDLRKYLRRKGDKENEKVLTCQSPTSNRIQKVQQLQLQPLHNSQKKSCPDLWKPIEQQTINLGKTIQYVNDVQFSEIVLSDRNQNEYKDIEQTYFQTNVSQQYAFHQPSHNQLDHSQTIQQSSQLQISQQQQIQEQDIYINEEDDIQSESSNESILNQISQPPPQIQDITPKNEVKPSQLFQSGHSTYIQINTAQSYLQPLLAIQDKSSNTLKPQENENKIIVNDSQKYYNFYNYQDYQKVAQQQYKHLFTHWPSLLHKLDQPEYVPNFRVVPYINSTPEQIFTILFPNSGRVKISYYAFENQLKHNLLQIDRDSLFKELDKDQDDWINYSETGVILEGLCLQVEQPKNCVKVIFETLKATPTIPNTLSLQDLELFEKKTDFQFAKQLMQEVDGNQKGYLTYWDLYMHRDIFLMERLCYTQLILINYLHFSFFQLKILNNYKLFHQLQVPLIYIIDFDIIIIINIYNLMDYWTLSGGVACRNGWSCRACKQNIYKGQEILVREGRKLRFHFHKGCFHGNGDPRTQNESTYFNQQRYGKISETAPEVKGYGKWSVGSYGYQPSFK